MTKCIAFHSYKGGTGKTTLACNVAALLAKKGHRVFLLDLDVSAPSIQAYFEKEPKKWINDFLNDAAEINDIAVDMTSLVTETVNELTETVNELTEKAGRLWVGFCNPKKEEIYKLEGGKEENSKMLLLRKLILLREHIISEYEADYIIIDTSPGIRYWSINALAISDILFLALKMGELDIDGTKKMAHDIYDSLTKYGAKSYLILNRVGGFCMPPSEYKHERNLIVNQESDIGEQLAKIVGMKMISAIPCYCDIQFSKREYLTVLKYPDHPFAEQIQHLIEKDEIKV